MMRFAVTAMAGLLLLAAGNAVAADTYHIHSELWFDGELRGSPELVVEADTEGSVETADGDSGWRLVFRVEPPAADEGAVSGALWLHIEVFEKVDGQWETLADSLLGLPPGRTGTFAIVDDPETDPAPENSRMYLRVGVRPLQ